jgi:hypothetical protein
MKRILLFVLILALSAAGAQAQKVSGTVRGVLQDSSSTPLGDATVSVLRIKDSSLISFTLTDSKGRFEINNIDTGEYKLIASYTSLSTLVKKFGIAAQKPVVDMGTIVMDRNYKSLDEVIIAEAPIKISGDTIAYKADAFKTKPNATVEDLLKKLPGVQVERDGTVKAQGENVQKVYVDGKEFFSNDPKLATKNLSADMVDQVQVYDDMSEQAKFNGIDDGSRSKAINLKLKKDKKKGLFGKAYAGAGGPGGRYDVGLNANAFKGATQTSVITKSNNNNNIGFTLSDMLGTMGGGMGGGMSGGGGGMMMGAMGSGMNMVSTGAGGMGGMMGGMGIGSASNSGITRSTQIGVNYRDTWSKTFDVNGSYFFNQTRNQVERETFRKTFFDSSTLGRDGFTRSQTQNDNHRFNFNMVSTIDSFNSIIYNPNLSYQRTYNSFSFDSSRQYRINQDGSQYLLNNNIINSNTAGNGYNFANNLIWRKKFRRAGRTFSLNLNGTFAHNERDVLQLTDFERFSENGSKLQDSTANVLNANESKTRNYGATISYTEPIARDKILEFNYGYTNNNSQSLRDVLAYDATTGSHSIKNPILSNEFENENYAHRFGTNLRVVKKKYNYQFGFALQKATLNSNNLTVKRTFSQNFTNIFPTFSFNYQFARSRNLRISYRGTNRMPSVSQLQNVPDVTNSLNVYVGNPALRQEFTNNVTLSYSFFDILKFRNFFVFLNFNNTMDKISNSITQRANGQQITMPVNLDGAFSLSGSVNYGLPIKKLKGGNFNTNTRFQYSRDVNQLVDTLGKSIQSYQNNVTVGEDLRLSYNYKEKLDVGLGVSSSYTSVRNTNTTVQGNNQSYFTHVVTGDITYVFPKGFSLTTDFDFNMYTGRSDGFNQNFFLWNASVAKELFKNKKGELRFSVNDILKQNVSINRTVQQNYIEDTRANVLQRFFMVTFTYKLNRMGGRNMPRAMERATRNVRIQ